METPIVNPEGGSKSSQTINLLIRLDVLGLSPKNTDGGSGVHVRATYEQSRAQSESDALDLEAAALDERYQRLEGHSIEFRLEPDGRVADFKGLEDVLPNRDDAEPALSWIRGLSAGAGLPEEGIVVRQRWRKETILTGLPLNDVVWRAESTYLRDEPCHTTAAGNAAQAGPAPEMCAVILTRFDIARRGPGSSDATPDEYRRNGLRTSGSWAGSGQSLDSISIATGLLVRSTQTSTQKMDYLITSASSGSSIHHTGEVQTRSEITLVNAAPAATRT